MKSQDIQMIVTNLINLGRRETLDAPSTASDFEQFRSYEHLSRLHWRNWYPTCEDLSIDDHLALLKAVVMAMRYSGWDSGSVAPGIWIYKKLEEKVNTKVAVEIANWVIERSTNPWMPFGTQKARQLFIAHQENFICDENSGSLICKLLLLDATDRIQREQVKFKFQKQQQTEKAKRLEIRKEGAEAHLARKHDNDRLRQSIMLAGEQSNSIGRLHLIVDHQDIPLLSFPEKWALVPKDDLKNLNKQTMTSLTKRLSEVNKGPWKILRDCLDTVL
jgi:hypothetical protein